MGGVCVAWLMDDDNLAGRRAILVDGYLPTNERVQELAGELLIEGISDIKKVAYENKERDDLYCHLAWSYMADYLHRVGEKSDPIYQPIAAFMTNFQDGFVQGREDFDRAFRNINFEDSDVDDEFAMYGQLLEREVENEKRPEDTRQIIVTYDFNNTNNIVPCVRRLIDRLDFEEKEVKDYVDYKGLKKYAELFLEELVINAFVLPTYQVMRNLHLIGFKRSSQVSSITIHPINRGYG